MQANGQPCTISVNNCTVVTFRPSIVNTTLSYLFSAMLSECCICKTCRSNCAAVHHHQSLHNDINYIDDLKLVTNACLQCVLFMPLVSDVLLHLAV